MKCCLGLLKYYKTNLFGSKLSGKVIFLIILPISNLSSKVLMVGPQSIIEEDTYYCPLTKELQNSVEEQIEHELQYNNEQKETEFIVLDNLECTLKKIKNNRNNVYEIQDDMYLIKFKHIGEYIKSDLHIILDPNESMKMGMKVYKVIGDINLDIEPTKLGVMNMKLRKKLAFFKGMKRRLL